MSQYKQLDEFYFWCQKVIPLVYNNSLSYYEVLCKVTDYLNNVIENQTAMYETIVIHGTDINKLQQQVTLIQQELDKFIAGDYTNLYIQSLANWIDKNLQELVGRVVKYVFFGLTDDGYFCAYIPNTWNFISFDTVMDPTDNMYGHLIMRW